MDKELEIGLRGTYVKNVYSLSQSQALRFGRPGGEDVWVIASPKHGAWVSQSVKERAETTPFTTRLRQELVRLRFASCAQHGLDRVFDLSLGEGATSRHLIVEMMPPGNIVVADEGMRVLVALREVRSRSRRLVRGEVYSPPLQRRTSPEEATAGDVARAVASEKTAGAVVGRGFALPRKYVGVVLARMSMTEAAPSASLEGREQELADTLRGLVSEVRTSPAPCLVKADGEEEVLMVEPAGHPDFVRAATASELCDRVLLQKVLDEAEEPEPQDSKARELEVTISRLKSREEGLAAEAVKVRELAARVRSGLSSEETSDALKSAGVVGPKSFGSAQAAASALFDRAKQLEKQAADSRQAAAELEKRRPRAILKRKRASPLRRAKKEWYEKFRWFITTGGRLAVGGRDAESNTILLRRHLEPRDTVYHADLFGSPFFLLKEGAGQTDEECAEVAQATVAFSSAWKTGLGAADAYWVTPDQVSSSAPSGEYLPRGGFLIKGRKSFLHHNLVELAVGLDASGRVLSGPEAAIRKNSGACVVLRPANEKSSETAKRVLKDLLSLAGAPPETELTVDDVLKALPAGGGKVLRKYGAGQSPDPPGNA